MPVIQNNYYVITGGPGVGKTTLLHELVRRGCVCVPEAARTIIQEQMSANGEGVPWRNNALYRDLMLSRSIRDYMVNRNSPDSTIFFDRGIPDTLAHCRLSALEETPELSAAVLEYRYNRIVFLLPPWQDIYVNDAERRQTFEESVQVYTVLRQVYRKAEYDVLELPCTSVQARTNYLLEYLVSTQC